MDARATTADKRRQKIFAKLEKDPATLRAKANRFYRKKQWENALDCLNSLLDDPDVFDSDDEGGAEHIQVGRVLW